MDKQNFVFISYSHKDVKWAKWLQKRLEWYRLPAEIHNQILDSRYIRPVFRDRDNLTSGILNEELRKHLESSQFLVVICSPNSARSEWVSNEVKAFIEMGRLEKIIPFIVDGEPQEEECFPLALRSWNNEHRERSILGISVTDDGRADKNKAFIRLVAHLLGVSFDSLWHRHKRFERRIVSAIAICAIALLGLSYWFMVPVTLRVSVESEKCSLPEMEHAVINLNGSEFSIDKPDTSFIAGRLPGYYRLRSIPLSFKADRFYESVDMTVPVGSGLKQSVTVKVNRDSTFAYFGGRVFDGDSNRFTDHPISGAIITIDDKTSTTDENGSFRICFPLNEQTETKSIIITRNGYSTFSRYDESPSMELMYLLHRQ